MLKKRNNVVTFSLSYEIYCSDPPSESPPSRKKEQHQRFRASHVKFSPDSTSHDFAERTCCGTIDMVWLLLNVKFTSSYLEWSSRKQHYAQHEDAKSDNKKWWRLPDHHHATHNIGEITTNRHDSFALTILYAREQGMGYDWLFSQSQTIPT